MADHIGIAVGQDSNDWHFGEDGNLAVVTGAFAVAQHVRQRLKHFAREWFLDTEAGVTWLDDVLGKQYDPTLAAALIKAEVLATDGVTDISDFSVSFDRTTRRISTLSLAILTIYDSHQVFIEI